MTTAATRLEQLIEPAIIALGYEMVGVEYLSQGRHSVLRIFIDRVGGIDVEGCAEVSHQVSAILDVEDPITGEYTLEVSSPGLERPLFKLKHYQAVVDEIISLRTRIPENGRKRFKGRLVSVDEERLVMEIDGQQYVIGLDNIDKANLVPQW